MDKFIYVFDTAARDKLLAEGFCLLKKDERANVYIFENKPKEHITFSNITYALSNTLTF